MSDFDTSLVDKLSAADEQLRPEYQKRTTQVQKYCEYCNIPVIVEQTEEHPLCEYHRGAAL